MGGAEYIMRGTIIEYDNSGYLLKSATDDIHERLDDPTTLFINGIWLEDESGWYVGNEHVWELLNCGVR